MKTKHPRKRETPRARLATPVPSILGNQQLVIEVPPEGTLRFRKIISRSAPRPTIKYFSVRLDRQVHCESILEGEAAELFDACSAIKAFAEQAVRLTFVMNGVVHQHVPDFVVTTAYRRAFVEVKYRDTIKAEDRDRTEHLKTLLGALGIDYYLVDEMHIHRSLFLVNARFILRRGRIEPSENEKVIIVEQVRTHGIALGDVTGTRRMEPIAWMILHGLLVVPMNEPFGKETLVTLPDSLREVTPWALELFM